MCAPRTAARDFHNGSFEAHVKPQGDTITFEDDGRNYGSGCKVRMQRIGPWLLIEDDGGCGGAAVTFTGLYRRESNPRYDQSDFRGTPQSVFLYARSMSALGP